MALLSIEERKKRFEFLGLGEYNETNIRKFQKQYLRKKDVDGIYGKDTDNLLRHVYNVKKFTKNFEPEEFKCECGGRYCTGYPTYMKKVELQNLQSIRTHFGKPMIVTCGVRCKPYNNSLRGSIQNSKHLTGYATDFYMAGVTDTLANRKKSIKWIKKLPNHNYTYGNGINSNGYSVAASYMGNALHTDTNKPVTTKKEPTIQDKIIDTCAVQAEHMKNYTYSWPKWKPRTVAQSAKYGTCVTFVSCVLQRLGLLKSGEYIWHNGKGFGTGKVVGANDKMTVTYMGNKTLTALKDKLKKGDVVMVDDNKSGEKGSGGHIFIVTGEWDKSGNPYIWDNESASRIKKGKSGRHTYSGKRKVLAVVRMK